MDHSIWLLLTLVGCIHAETPKMYGEVTSPNYPQGYHNNVQESWEISVPQGFGIQFYFIHLDIEPSRDCEYDSVQVMIGDEEKLRLCGRRSEGSPGSPLHEQYFPTNTLRIQFTSDFSNEERYTGFSAYYIAVDLDECTESDCTHFCNNYIGGYVCSCRPGYLLHPDNQTCEVNCSGNLYTDLRGQISSPAFPSQYPENSLCQYKVRLVPGFQVVLTFQAKDFDIEAADNGKCIYDTLTIQAGEKTFGPYCGKTPPPRIDTGSNEVDIIFQTDSGGDNKGWRVHYSEDAIPCDHLVFEHSLLYPRKDKYIFTDTVSVTCEEGYELVSTKVNNPSCFSFQSTCQGDGTWTTVEPKCQPVDCGPPTSIDNGFPNFSQTKYLSNASYSCVSEYYKLTLPASGDDIFYCSSEGLWVGKDGGKELPECVAVCGGFKEYLTSGRIYGGKKAEPGEFPWQIAFIEPRRGSGALISDRWVLTAAHVVEGDGDPIMFGGFVDMRNRNKHKPFKARKIIIHPKWTNEDLDKRLSYDNDIALIQLCSKVELGPNIKPICLPGNGKSPGIGRTGYIAGWGKTEKKKQVPVLQFTRVPLSDIKKCKELDTQNKYTFTSNMMCAGDIAGHDSCEGDSGGPLMFTDQSDESKMYTAGIVSWGIQCGTYGVYTKVENYLDWIKETIKEVEKEETGETQRVCE
ncbi:complement C1s subcomponent [Pelodytes ibericus]